MKQRKKKQANQKVKNMGEDKKVYKNKNSMESKPGLGYELKRQI